MYGLRGAFRADACTVLPRRTASVRQQFREERSTKEAGARVTNFGLQFPENIIIAVLIVWFVHLVEYTMNKQCEVKFFDPHIVENVGEVLHKAFVAARLQFALKSQGTRVRTAVLIRPSRDILQGNPTR